jgi:hypothetical protein
MLLARSISMDDKEKKIYEKVKLMRRTEKNIVENRAKKQETWRNISPLRS